MYKNNILLNKYTVLQNYKQINNVNQNSVNQNNKSLTKIINNNSLQQIQRPISQQIQRPMIQQIQRPITQQIQRPISQQIQRPITQQIQRPISQQIQRPISQQIQRPLTQQIQRPSTQKNIPIQKPKNKNKQLINNQQILFNKMIRNNNQINYTSLRYNINKIIIITSSTIESIAYNISKFLQEINYHVVIQHTVSENECMNSTENELYIFLNTMIIKHNNFPKLFILYQLEQSQSKWFTDKYRSYLNNCQNIWEFAIKNKILYDNINLNKIFYTMTPFYYDNSHTNSDINHTYDIFFYGAANNRRRTILNNLSKIFNIKIGFSVFGDEKNKLIEQSKIILNLHFYDDCALEACRLNEILQYDKIIISEKPCAADWYNQSLYDNLVDFVDVINDDLSNIDNLINKIKYYLDSDNYNNKINEIKRNKMILHNKSKFNLYKNLYNIINTDKHMFDYDLIQDKIYCLHLIETPERINEFKKINQDKLINQNIEIFPAFKFNPGWKGCALSYVNLMYNAKRCNLDNITVCEDDCRFPNDFNEKYKIIKEFLNTIKWDIFVGVIADLSPDVKITNIYEYKNIKFIELSYITSTVFNIYNKSVYNIFLEWNIYNDNDKYKNTIDRYINNKNLIFITTYPFYFDCIDVNSTIWNKNLYNEYNRMFQKSLNILNEKINKFNNI